MIAAIPVDDLRRTGLRPFAYYSDVYDTRPKLRHRGRVFVAGPRTSRAVGGALEPSGRGIIATVSCRSGRATEQSANEKTRREMAVSATGKGFHANEW